MAGGTIRLALLDPPPLASPPLPAHFLSVFIQWKFLENFFYYYFLLSALHNERQAVGTAATYQRTVDNSLKLYSVLVFQIVGTLMSLFACNYHFLFERKAII